MLNPLILTGEHAPPLVTVQQHYQLQPIVAQAFAEMAVAAKTEGICLQLVSAWRSFADQSRIWQAKISGQRPVYNQLQQQLDMNALTGCTKLDAILLYSALPGASRHHWGTDFDLYDSAAVAADYRATLDPVEYLADGPFAKLSQWLSCNAAQFGFFLPYRQYQGGVAAEPWHLSYQPLAQQYLETFQVDILTSAINQSNLTDKALILQHLPQLFQRYVLNICESTR